MKLFKKGMNSGILSSTAKNLTANGFYQSENKSKKEKQNTWILLDEKAMEHEDGDTNCSWYPGNSPKEIGKEWGIENPRKNWDCPNC